MLIENLTKIVDKKDIKKWPVRANAIHDEVNQSKASTYQLPAHATTKSNQVGMCLFYFLVVGVK